MRLDRETAFWGAVLLFHGAHLMAASNTQVLTTVHAIEQWGTRQQIGSTSSVDLTGTITYSDPEWGLLWVQDQTGAVYVDVHGSKDRFASGTRVHLEGQAFLSDSGIALKQTKVHAIGAGALPVPTALSIAQLNGSIGMNRYVSVRGVIRSGQPKWTHTELKIVEGTSASTIVLPLVVDSNRFVGSRVHLTAVAGSDVDANNQRIGSQLFVGRPDWIEVEQSPVEAEMATPLPIEEIRPSDGNERFSLQRHIRGSVTWQMPGLFFIGDGSGVLWVRTDPSQRVEVGQTVDVIGFPVNDEHGLGLADSKVSERAASARRARSLPPYSNAADTIRQFANPEPIRLRARLISQTSTPQAHSFILEDRHLRFRATLPRNSLVENIIQLPLNALLEINGIALVHPADGDRQPSLEVLIASPADVVVVEGNALFNWKRIAWTAVGIFIAAILVFVWIFQLRRTVRRQTGDLRARLERELQLESQYRRLFERNLAAVYRWKPDGTIIDCNAAFARMLGYGSPKELVGQSYWDRQYDPQTALRLRNEELRPQVSNRDAHLRRADGDRVCLLENISAVQSADGLIYETTAIDVTPLLHHQAEMERAKDAAVRQALNDALTGLPNRRLLLERLHHTAAMVKRDGTGLALMYVDLDGFKLVNDSFGHTTGDQLLIEVAARLQARVRASDTVARMGSDEFIIVLAGVRSRSECTHVADDLLRVILEPISIGERRMQIGASIGISLFPEDADTPDQLLQQADSAMYAAKRKGKNRALFFTEELGTLLRERLNLEQQLRGAIERNEIAVHYQPEFDALSGALIRFEALARWTHPDLGPVPPEKFIPIAEETGLIGHLGAHILRLACSEAVEWQEMMGTPVQLAVNVSNIQFRTDHYADEVFATLAHTGLAPHLLQLELTESVMMDGNAQITSTMRSLQSAGVSLAVDDFGTGYSCLSTLQSSAFDCLKIDRSFLRENRGEAMVQSVVALAHNIGMRVIVEGVENVTQLELIRRLGGDEVQGFLLGRPTPDPRMVIMSRTAGRVKETVGPEAQLQEV